VASNSSSDSSRPLARIASRLPGWLHVSDIRGLAQLATDGVLGATALSETVQGNVYKSVAAVFGPLGRRFIDTRPGRSGVKPIGITGLVYGSIRGVTRLAGGTVKNALARAAPLLPDQRSSARREAMLSALNGVLGDHLLETANPLAITMRLRHLGRSLALERSALAVAFPEASSKLLVTVHGLCMNDLQWHGAKAKEGAAGAAGQADALARSTGCTLLDLHYNTGLHTSVNGAQLAALLDRLVAAWPRPVGEITLLAHSMGGLVVRSACHHAERDRSAWRAVLRNIVFLGTPHYGATLEQVGNWVDRVLGSNLMTLPFARIGKIRSSGITDLRHGHVLTSSWEGRDRFAPASDTRLPLPLPAGVRCFAVAGRVAGPAAKAAFVGDGLVPLASALGEHADVRQALAFEPHRQWIAEGVNHMALLTEPGVGAQLVRWLGEKTSA
jgi:hypothetical protein